MSKKGLIVGLTLVSVLLLACACNLGDYFGNIFQRVQEELGNNTPGIDGTVPLEEWLEDTPDVTTEETAVTPESEEATVEEQPDVLTNGWLVVETENGLWTLDDQGNNFHNVYSGQYLSESSAAASGGHVAFIQSETENGEGMLNLGMVNLSDDSSAMIGALTNDQTALYPSEDINIGDAAREASMAMMFDNLSWSPDGRYLAFIGAQEGEFASLYTYDLQSGVTNRLAGGQSHQYKPVWSPDSQYILAPSATSFGTGAGFAMDSMWIAWPDGSEVRALFGAGESIDQEIWGWMDAHTMLFSPVGIMAGYKNLQLVDISSGAVREISGGSDYFYDADLSPSAGTVMFTFPFDDITEWVEGETITEPGLYLYRADTGAVEKISDTVDYGSWVVWDDRTQCYYAYLSLAVGGGSGYVQPYNPFGQIDGSCPMLPVGVTALPEFSPSGEYYFWRNESWANPESNALSVGVTATGEPVTVQAGTVSFAVWHPTEDTVYYVQDRTIYKASAPDFIPVAVADAGMTVQNFYWAMP